MDNKMHLAMQIFDSMAGQYDTRPNVVTFNTMIKGFGSSKQNEQMMEMLERMKRDGNTHRDIHTFFRSFLMMIYTDYYDHGDGVGCVTDYIAKCNNM